MKKVKFVWAVVFLAGGIVYGQGLIQNGDFESWTNNQLDGWQIVEGAVATPAVGLDGTGLSVNLGKTGGDGDAISQTLGSAISDYFYVQFDFAYGPQGGASRTMNVTFKSPAGSTINVRVNGDHLEFYGSADGATNRQWRTVAGTEGQLFASNFDTNTLVVYRIIIAGTWQQVFNVSLKNLTTDTDIITDVTLDIWQSTGSPFTGLYLERGRSGSDWRADNLMVYDQDPTIPVVDAGANQQVRLPANSVQMNPSVFDLDTPQENLSFSWSQVSGPAASFGTLPGQTENDKQAVITLDGGPGLYEFMLTVSDPQAQTGDDTMLVRFKSASDDVLLGHWAFEDDPQGTTAVDSLDALLGNTAPDDGVLVGLPTAADPNSDPNWVAGWVDDQALDFWDDALVDIAVNPNSDPNMAALEWEITLAGWVQPDAATLSNQYNTIIARANPFNWVLRQLNTGVTEFTLGLESGNLFTAGTVNLVDGYWHHVAGTYNGTEVKIYVDGLLDVSLPAEGFLQVHPEAEVTIGGRYDHGHPWTGRLDDVRVYSYGLSAEEIQDLVRLGRNVIPYVTIDDSVATELIITFQDSVELTADVVDFNMDQGQQVSVEWSVTNPLLADQVQFDPADAATTTVTFLEPGIYTLRITVQDEFGAGAEGDLFDEITFIVKDAVCEDMLMLDPDSGQLYNPQLSFDVSGPDGVPDCYVNLYDFAEFAQQWLLCNDPQGEDCQVITK
ncbi:MAG: hypothetical protein JW810_08075 [Sedimentisphaerales bacterium]|nr:hypothetical protein [Sedimentisphaerales bacterium]